MCDRLSGHDMTRATRKLPVVLAVLAVFLALLNSLLTANVLAAANDVEDVRNVVAA
jgi:hypothetical protein